MLETSSLSSLIMNVCEEPPVYYYNVHADDGQCPGYYRINLRPKSTTYDRTRVRVRQGYGKINARFEGVG